MKTEADLVERALKIREPEFFYSAEFYRYLPVLIQRRTIIAHWHYIGFDEDHAKRAILLINNTDKVNIRSTSMSYKAKLSALQYDRHPDSKGHEPRIKICIPSSYEDVVHWVIANTRCLTEKGYQQLL